MGSDLARRAILWSIATASMGCLDREGNGGEDGLEGTPLAGDAEQLGSISLTSSAFEDGGRIPARYAREGGNENPPLEISGVPASTRSFVILVDDPDAREVAGRVWIHWFVWDVPPSRRSIPAGWSPPSATVGRNDFDAFGYDGPAPPDRTHRYRFKLYALDVRLGMASDAERGAIGSALRDHVLARTQLVGRFGPEEGEA